MSDEFEDKTSEEILEELKGCSIHEGSVNARPLKLIIELLIRKLSPSPVKAQREKKPE